MNTNVPYFDNAYDWVKSLPYDKPLYMYKGKDFQGYTYENPFNSRWGVKPLDVYNRLFCRGHYYNLTDEELTELRTTIQYLPIYLDTAFNNTIKFLETCGFKLYKKQGKPGDLIHAYMKRNNVSLYISNQTTPQDYRPNKINVSVGELIKKPCWKSPRRVECVIEGYDYGFDNTDDFGEQTKQNLENYIKKYMTEIISFDEIVYKEAKTLTFKDLYKFTTKSEKNKQLTIPVYVVNIKSGTIAVITNANFDTTNLFKNKLLCSIFCGKKYSFSFYVKKEQENNTIIKQMMFPYVGMYQDNPLYTNYILCLNKHEAKRIAIKTIKDSINKQQNKIQEIKAL